MYDVLAMRRTPARCSRSSLAGLIVVLAAMLPGALPGAFAAEPAGNLRQFAHTAWKIRDGFIKGRAVAIAQTPDGYLWLGTEFGLLRFDGVRAVPWPPHGG